MVKWIWTVQLSFWLFQNYFQTPLWPGCQKTFPKCDRRSWNFSLRPNIWLWPRVQDMNIWEGCDSAYGRDPFLPTADDVDHQDFSSLAISHLAHIFGFKTSNPDFAAKFQFQLTWIQHLISSKLDKVDAWDIDWARIWDFELQAVKFKQGRSEVDIALHWKKMLAINHLYL